MTVNYQFGFGLLMAVFCLFLVPVLWYRWAQGRSDRNAPLKKSESFRYSFFLVAFGFFGRWLASGRGDDLAERMMSIEWATNMQNAMCFTAVVCALEVLYNQRANAAE